ncbi:hypothetical protein Tco_0899114 [Tanacetum coccineum]
MEICPIEGYQVCRVPVTIGKSCKVEVLCIVDDIDECHILLRRPWQCEVNGKYDVKRNLYLFSWEGRRIAMVPPKRKSIEDKVCRKKVFDVDEALDIENSWASSFQVRGIHVDKTKALVKAFKLPTEPHHSPYQIGWIKKGPALKVTKICKVPLAIGKNYNDLVTCDVDIETCHVLLGRPWQHDMDTKLKNKTLVTLVASPKKFQAERKETRVSYALVVKGVEDVMENAIPAVIKPLLTEFGKIVTDDTLDALPPLRNIQYQIDLSRKTTLLVSISNEVLGFDSIKKLYANDEDFGNIWMELETKQHRGMLELSCRDCRVQEGKGKAQNTGFLKMAHFNSMYKNVFPMRHQQILQSFLTKSKFVLHEFQSPLFRSDSSTGFSPFEVVYKTSLRHVVDLVDLPGKKNVQANRMVEEVQATHEVVLANITEANDKYKIAADKHRQKKLFQVGDEVMVFLRKECFSVVTYSKLQPKKYGMYKILRKINDNAYVVDLPNTMSISKTFNVLDIYEFHSVDVNEGKHSRTSSSKERGNDEDMIQELAGEYMDKIQERGKSKSTAKNK